MKLHFAMITSMACLSITGCHDTPKQVEYAQSIEEHLDNAEKLITNNHNTIDSSNRGQLREEWGLVTDLMTAYQAEEKAHPCTLPECATAFRKGREHVSKFKAFVLRADHSAAVDLNNIFPTPRY